MDSRTPWRGQRDTTRRALAKLLVLSLLLHLPLTPLARLAGLARLLTPPDEAADVPEMTAIPIDLLVEEEGPNVPPPAAPPEPEAMPAPETEKAPEQPKTKPEVDAGAPEPEDAGSDAADDAGLASDAGERPERGVRDPIAIKGSARRVIDTNANVQLRVYTSRIRKHPLGSRIGRLLGSVYQWRDFFGPAGLDPIRDVDQIMVIGPQFRDSSKVVAVLKLNVPDERTRLAVDAIVQGDRESGQWLEDAGVPVATARADRAERVFVLAGSSVVAVVPPHLREDTVKNAKALASQMRDRGGSEVVAAKVKTPWRALSGMFRVPKSIKVAKLHVVPTAQGGAEIIIEAEDESAELASENAAYLESAVAAATQLDLGFFGSLIGAGDTKFVSEIDFSTEGEVIHGRIVVTEQQLLMIMDLVAAYIGAPPPRRRSDAGTR